MQKKQLKSNCCNEKVDREHLLVSTVERKPVWKHAALRVVGSVWRSSVGHIHSFVSSVPFLSQSFLTFGQPHFLTIYQQWLVGKWLLRMLKLFYWLKGLSEPNFRDKFSACILNQYTASCVPLYFKNQSVPLKFHCIFYFELFRVWSGVVFSVCGSSDWLFSNL